MFRRNIPSVTRTYLTVVKLKKTWQSKPAIRSLFREGANIEAECIRVGIRLKPGRRGDEYLCSGIRITITKPKLACTGAYATCATSAADKIAGRKLQQEYSGPIPHAPSRGGHV